MASGAIVDTAFPAISLVPKTETGVLNFLQKYPEHDGRDTIIAIFDSGVDPKAAGLKTVSDGSVKVIERYDCSGCGDTDVSKKVTADAKGCITGISGRSLKLTPEMVAANNANGEYRVGLKSVSDLYPSKIRDSVVYNKKLKTWDKPNKTAIADVLRKLSEFDAQNSDASKLSWDKKLEKDNLEFEIEFLNNYDKMYSDIKTSYDVVVYPTESGWQTVIDTSLKGDLENAVHLGEYSKTHEIKNLDSYLSVSINVHDNGNVVELVGMCSPHGTHVASIASGNHDDSKDVNGVAPNAKIVSLTLGDGRLGSMETGTALVRAMMKVMELCESGRKVDVINMSYGEHAAWSNCGRIGELMSEVVNKYGVVWVASAGNHGPALSTIGTPPDISQPSCIGVGAYVSPQMMEVEYALREKLPANVYTWTSRDPCIDGGQGVTVCAPGAAITSVPQFTMCKSQLMNGTSMAAPHVAGAVALLISGLKQKGVSYSPFSIKRAICATATKLNYVDPFAQGSGLLNVEKAFDYLMQHKDAAENTLRFSIRVSPHNAKGIYIREGFLKKAHEYNVNVEPIYMNEKEADPKDKINFNVRLNLVSSHPFVQCGNYLDLCYGTRPISVRVDPTGLPPGVHSAAIKAFDSSDVEKGPLFEIPVTIVQPHVLNTEQSRLFNSPAAIEFQPNTIQRDFILVPNNATWAVLKMRSTDTNRDKEVGKFFVHTMQLLPVSSCRKLETMKILNVTTENETSWPFKVQANNILELCIAKYWSNFGNTHVKYSLEFHGISASPKATVMHSAKGIHRFQVTALSAEDFQPAIQLKTAAVVLKPTETKITPLSPTRDVIPPGRQIYQNVLTYNLNVAKAQDISIHAPLFNSLLYESEFESQLWMLYDVNKMMIACGDAHSHTFCTKLEKGEYTIRLQIRHEKKEALEKISEATMVALFKLSSPISLDIYDQYNQCIVGGRKFNSCTLQNTPKVVYVAPLNGEKLSKASLPNGTTWLNGNMSLAKDDAGRRVQILKFQYLLAEAASSASSSSSNSSSSSTSSSGSASGKKTNGGAAGSPGAAGNGNGGNGGKTSNGSASPKKSAKSGKDDYAEALRDFQCSLIAKMELEKAEELYNTVIAGHPKHLTAHLMYIQNLESTHLKPQFPFTFAKNIATAKDTSTTTTTTTATSTETKLDIACITTTLESVADKAGIVIKETDKDALLAYYGLKNDTRSDAAKIKTEMEKQKNNLLEALTKKGIAVAKLNVIENGSQKTARLEEIDAIFTEIGKFTDATDSKVVNFTLWHAYVHCHHGRMAKILQKLYDDKRSRDVYEELGLVTAAAKWNHVEEAIERLTVTANPMSYRLF